MQEFIHVSTPQENSFIEAYHSIIQKELLQPRQFFTIEEAIEIFNRWRLFYNNRRLHGRLRNITPAYKWDHYQQQQMNEEQMMINRTIALSTNGERNTLQIEESRLVDKVVEEQKLNIFEINNH